MFKTTYSKKFNIKGLNFRAKNLFNEEKEIFTELKINKDVRTTKNSLKLFINLKKLKNPFKKKEILTPTNKNVIPAITKLSIIKNNKVPSMQDNKKDIMKFIKKRKMEQKNEIDNYYNSILIKESKLFRNNLYITQSENKFFRSNSNLNINNVNKIRKAFSHNKERIKNKKRINYFQNATKDKKNNDDITGSTSVDYLKNNFEKKSSYYDSMINNITSDTKITYLFSNKENSKSRISNINKIEHNLFYQTAYRNMKKELTKSKSCIEFSRIRSEINEAICNDLKNKDDYCLLGRQLMKFNVIYDIQKNKLKKIMSKEEYNYGKKYDKLINLKEMIINSYKTYFEGMDKYLEFLYDKIKENRLELNIYDKQIKEIDDDLEIIIVKIVKFQTYLQYLVERRNFLLLIKQRFGQPTSYYDELFIRDSKILLVGDAICNLKVTKLIKNKNVIDFNNTYLEVQEKIKQRGLNIDNLKNYSSGIITKDQLFKSVDEFIQLYKNSENKNLKYLRDKENLEKQLITLNKIYKEEKMLNQSDIMNEIEEKEKELKKLTDKNIILMRTYEHYKKIILKNSNSNRNLSNMNKKNEKKISSIDMNALKKYQQQLEEYKFDGLLLLHKLIELLKNLSHIKYDKSKLFFDIFNDKNLKEIFNLNLLKYNKEKLSSINNYIILLISKYEIICKYIINKNNIYLLNENNEEFIKEKAAQLTLIKKKKNSEELRKIIKDKKIEDIKKIVEKFNKITAYIPNKLCPENNAKRYKAMKEIERKIINDNKNHYLEYEFNSLIHYKDNF